MGVFAFLATLAAASVLSPHGAVAGRRVQIWAEVPSRGLGSPLQRILLKHATLVSPQGKLWVTDSQGSAPIDYSPGTWTLLLDSPHFRIRLDGHPVEIQFQPKSSESSWIVAWNQGSLGALMCRTQLQRARETLRDLLPRELQGRLDPAITCQIHTEGACNSYWDGQDLHFFQGTNRCQSSAENSDMIFHEYGHAVLDRVFSDRVAPERPFTEAFADLTSALLTQSPRFAEGFWKERHLSWLRNLAELKRTPQDERGDYTASLVFSSLAWRASQASSLTQVYQSLLNVLSRGVRSPSPGVRAEVARRMGLNAFLLSHAHPNPSLPSTRVVTLQLSSLPRNVPDAPEGWVAGEWLSFPYSFTLADGETVTQMEVELDIDHLLPDDIQVGYQSSGNWIDFFKGEEEISLPVKFTLPAATPRQGAIGVRDVSHGLTGSVRSAQLRIWISASN